jgi:hypothetical protein
LLATLGGISEQILIIFFVSSHRPVVLREALPDFGLKNPLNTGDITVLMVSYWSWGLVLLVLTRKQNLKGSICFKLTNECWETFSENYGKS